MPLARADSSNAWAAPRLCSMKAAPKPRPRMETSAPVRPSCRRSTGRDSAFADGEAAREIKLAMAPPKSVRRMKSRRELPAFMVQDGFRLIPRQRRAHAVAHVFFREANNSLFPEFLASALIQPGRALRRAKVLHRSKRWS